MERAGAVNLVVIPLLLTGAPFTQHVTVIVVKTELWKLVILSVAVPDARREEVLLPADLVLPDILGKEQTTTGVTLVGNFLKMYILFILMNIA